MALVKAFADENFFRLNPSKCEIVMFSRDQNSAVLTCEVDGSVLPAGVVGKCLGNWWKSALLATKSKKTSRKLTVPFSTMEVLGCFRVTSVPSCPGLC